MGVREIDPATGRQLPSGVQYRGPMQYRARKLVHGKRVTKTFDTARQAADWRTGIEVDKRRGVFVDLSEAERKTLADILTRYKADILGEDSEKDGAEREGGMIDVILRDEMCAIKMARLQSADVAGFRDRMKADGYALSTIVRRLNLVATAISHARREWRINIVTNPASAEQCARPKGADHKRDRILLPAPKRSTDELDQRGEQFLAAARSTSEIPPAGDGDAQAEENLSEEERLLKVCAAASDPWLLPATQLALFTAMRQGEICALEWPDIDFEARTIIVRGPERQNGNRRTKNGETRTIPFLPGVEKVLLGL
ncbi:MAG TPA: tyrosine-type recombinase/integrase, partial [Candidatus Sulfotelmatobacter sp.]|nr:tyrosine-type recombinase/integrase [Candidatus Sulfotelmatobacter sp.]